jgi:transcriptional regulator with XRE-family HTH domain
MLVAERIIQLRTRKGYSTNKLAQLAEIGQSTLREIEIGKKSPNIVTLEKICQALDISLAEFFSEDHVNIVTHDTMAELPEHVKKEIALIKEFILYKHNLQKPTADK